MRKFKVSFDVFAEIELDEDVFSAVDDSFREHLYNLRNDEEIVEMVASCILRGMSLSQLDGWADLPDSNAFVSHENWDLVEFEEEKL